MKILVINCSMYTVKYKKITFYKVCKMTVCLHSLLCGQPFIGDNNLFVQIKSILRNENTITAHPWWDGYSTSISACEVWGGKDWDSSFQEGVLHRYTRWD